MRKLTLLACFTVFTAPTTVFAGENVLYEDAPEWVVPTELPEGAATSGSAFVLIDGQSRIANGQLTTYVDTAVALDTPQALTQFGTVAANWLPDKGDLIVHRVELIRDGETVDLIKGGAEFEVIRREQGLESRLLSGVLTATMNVSGAQIGDVLRVAYSTTLSDQALGDNVQWQSPLIAEPFPLKQGRVSISWPSTMDVSRKHLGNAEIGEPVLEDGYYTWSTSLPVEKPDPTPGDAPSRFTLGHLLQVTTFSSYKDVSQSMAQHFDPSDTLAPGGDLAGKVAAIAAQTSDPLERTALALRMVQDDVSYLLNGLNGGNYLPQSPEETWENRFGDCKAKSLLLLAVLRDLGIEAEVVLVRTQGGDALPELAPMPANFDHMIVRAQVAGKNYWLDGTTSGTRIDTLDSVPRFSFALPLTKYGAELMPLDVRPLETPNQTVRLTIDQSAGVQLPALFAIEIEMRGQYAGLLQTLAEQSNDDLKDQAIYQGVVSQIGDAQLIDQSLSFDAETGVATITAKGIRSSGWVRDQGRFEWEPFAQAAANISFDSDRARAAWRDIPLRLNGPIFYTSELEVILPNDKGGFELDGRTDLDQVIGGVELSSKASHEGNRFTLSQSMRSIDEELPAEDISTARRNLTRFTRTLPTIRSSGSVRELWEYLGEDKELLEPTAARYAKIVADADDDDPTGHTNRARFRLGVFDFAGALEDVEAALEIEASRSTYLMRANLHRQLGDLDKALDDYFEAENLQPDGSTFQSQVEVLALLDRAEEGLDLVDEFEAIAETESARVDLNATALGWAGSSDEGLEALEALVARRPGDGGLLNQLCWFAGIWDKMTQERLAYCSQAVEKSDFSAAALDSRALAHYRMGDLDAARADIDAALLSSPGLAAARLMKGIIRVAQGETEGRADIDLALSMRPAMRKTYGAWGLLD